MNPFARRLALVPMLTLAVVACSDGDGFDGDESPPAGQPAPPGPAAPTQPATQGKAYKWSFDDVAPGGLPPGFVGPLGDWKVQPESAAQSAPNVLRQLAKLSGSQFPLVYVDTLEFTDATVKVRCRPESGVEDQACGLVFRLQDKGNYFITRANALEGNVRLYKVVNGVRQQFATVNRNVTAGQWHTLEATAKGTSLSVGWDGETLIQASEATFAKGRVGIWVKADSITAFDDFEVTAL